MEVKKVAITGAAGAIGYAALFRIASGQLLGPDQPIDLRLLELPGKPVEALGKGVFMEIHDCAFPLLRSVVCTSDPKIAFEGADYALLVGARPRGKGMQRADLLRANARIFKEQGLALGQVANPDVKVVVVGNPANTNALITARFACSGRGVVDPTNITAMTRLDHNRGVAMLAERAHAPHGVRDVEKFCIWGNHSDTMVPDTEHCVINGLSASMAINDEKWLNEKFVHAVKTRGSAVIAARGTSSAGSAANAAIDHMHDWMLGTKGHWTSMAIYSDGAYGVNNGLYSSFPVITEPGGHIKVVNGLKVSEKTQKAIDASKNELLKERDIAFKELGL